jgi:ribosomal protein S12 methylthiotransferase
MQTQLLVNEETIAELVGKTVTVLCDGFDTVADIYYGRTYRDAPDVDGKVYFTAKKRVPAGRFVKVLISEALDYDLVGEATEIL